MEEAQRKFLSRAELGGAEDCWLWKGCTSSDGYGSFRFAGRSVRAHRFAAHLFMGFDLASELQVCHHCDVRACVNPSHLFVGTLQDNQRDKIQKQRQCIGIATDRAKRNGQTKLTLEQVREVRTGGASQRQFARRFGVTRQAIQKVLKGESWRAVT